jgi:hypothetical protein
MSRPNVEALAALLIDAALDRNAEIWLNPPEGWTTVSWRRMAEALASRGVLVVSSLTDEQANAVADEGVMPDLTTGGAAEYFPQDFPEALARIASKG